MARTDLTDQEWERLASKLPSSTGKRGGQYKDHRLVLNGILWVLRTGAPWRDLPERYGKWKTCHDRLLRWRRRGIWEQALQALQGEAEAVGDVVWTVVSIDGTTVRAHQHAAGARSTPATAEPPAAPEKGGSRAGRRGARSQSRRLDHQAAPRRRRSRAAADGLSDARPAARKHATGAGARRHPRAAAARPAPEATGPSGAGQRLQLSEVPEGAPWPQDPACDPGAERPTSAATGERRPGGPAAAVRPGGVPAAQLGRALCQPAEAVSAGGHPLREAGGELLGLRALCLHYHLAQGMIRRTRPSLAAVLQFPW